MVVIDLFCGAGGFSVGMEQAGHTVKYAFDFVQDAVDTYNKNLDGDAVCVDLAENSPEEVCDEYGIDVDDITGVIGGAPCQSFSIAGLRDPDDDRSKLVLKYLDWVEYVDPDFFMMENVPNMKHAYDSKYFDELVSQAESMGYNVDARILNAADYGVPQTRERLFVVGLESGEFEFPEPTHGENV